MHHYVDGTAGSLPCGQGICQLGIHYGKPATVSVGVIAFLEPEGVVGYDAAVAHLAACGGNREHAAYRKPVRRNGLAVIEVPDIAVIEVSHAYGLAGVDDRASAYGQQEVDAFLAAERDSFVHHAQAGVGNHSSEGDILYSGSLETGLYPGEQPGPDGASPSVMHENPASAVFPNERGHLVLLAASQQHARRSIIVEIYHNQRIFSPCP